MDELSDYTSPVIEFKATYTTEKQSKLIDNSTATDPLPMKIDASVETHQRCSQETQTVTCLTTATNMDEHKLAMWLQKIYPSVEKELLKGCTPVATTDTQRSLSTDVEIQPYQKLTLPAAENSQGLAIWLSVYANNAPILAATSIAPHDDWCEHVDQYIKFFVPKRIPNTNFITYNEMKSIPIKACLQSLCTNPFNKNIFAGSTLDGDIYVWKYEQNIQNTSNNIQIKELYNATLRHGYAVAIDWSNEHTLLTAHTNGYVVQWHLGKEIVPIAEFLIKQMDNVSTEICTLLALSMNDFVVGAKDGAILHCWISSLSAAKHHLEIIPLKKHLFMPSTLLKSHLNGYTMVISCDLSGQLYIHDLRNSDDDTDTIIAQIPLPFTNVIACSRDGNIIYSPGEDGSLECYRLSDGLHFTIKGALKGKGNFIKSSDNGNWMITGLYENEFQIFSIEF